MKVFFIIFFLITAPTFYQKQDVAPKLKAMAVDKDLGTWQVKNGILIETNKDKTSLALYNWNVFYNIFPKKITQKYIKRLVLFSDGVDEKTGALGALNRDNTEWQLVLDPADVDFQTNDRERLDQSLYTLLHEFGHLLTLNNTQIKPTVKKEADNDEPYLTIEGQALENSYINKFVVRFWNGSLLNQWDYIQKEYCFTEQKSCLEKLYGLYEENYTDFLTDYAAESPEEDIVESWTAFVLQDSKIRNPQTVGEQKINFFYQFPELVNYRKIIRKNIRKYQK